MDTHTSDQLSHAEAFELLPWHINATLDEPLSERVAHHVEHCSTCQEESAVLSNTVVALNTGDAVTTNLDARFARVLGRVRDYEHAGPVTSRSNSVPLGERVAAWFGLSMPRAQWAGAFVLGLAVGIGVLLTTMRSIEVDSTSPPVYETHSSAQAPLRLQLDFDHPPAAAELADLKRTVADSVSWHRVSETRFLVEFPDDLTVKAVTDVRSRLLANDAVINVAIDIDSADPD